VTDHGRPWAAIDLLSLRSAPENSDPGPDPALVIRALDASLAADSIDESSRAVSAEYEIGVLLEYLEQTGTAIEVLARLEWAFFPLLDHSREPEALYAALAEQPELFVDLVCRVYRGKGEPPSDTDERTAALARHSWSVLDAWRRVPGMREDGSIDEEHLRSWVNRARRDLAGKDREAIGDQQIGQLLSAAPVGDDGAWPAEPIRNLIEEIESEDLETGLEVGRYNARGITIRAAYAGGDQERALSQQYQEWSNIVAPAWPRTGRILQYFADQYEREARAEDARAQRDASEG
jgi:hypothetical protein